MMRRAKFLAAAVMLATTSCSGADRVKDGVATDDGIAAIALPKEQFDALLTQSVLTGQIAAMHLYSLGHDEGCDVLNDAVDAAVARNLPNWRSNLTTAYREAVPSEELAKAVEMSPRAARESLKGYLPEIASAMQRASEPLLKTAHTEVLTATGDAAAKVNPADIDVAARKKELESMKASGEICGFRPLQREAA